MADLRLPFAVETIANAGLGRRSASTLAGIAVGIAASALLLILAGVEPAALLQEFVLVFLTSPQNAGSVVFQAEPLIFAGLAGVAAFRARFWNIGIEGQMIMGAIAATLMAQADILAEPLRLPAMAIFAAVGGATWIAAPALLKRRLGVNEIISTLLLNYVAINMLLWLLYGIWKDPVSSFPYSAEYDASERLPQLGWERVDAGLLLAIVFAVALAVLLSRSRFGFLLAFVESNETAARALGLSAGRIAMMAVLMSGALAGLAGFVISAGVEYRLTQSFFNSYGFSGILIAFLAGNRPLATVFVALAMGLLLMGGQSLQVFYGIPASMAQLIQAILIIAVAASQFFAGHRLVRVRRRETVHE